jgi:myosin heavy subunit
MKSLNRVTGILLGAVVAASAAIAQETVTIKKSRLEELERKEAELEKLKAELATAKGELKTTKSELGSAKSELGTTKTELSETKKELTSAQTQNEEFKKQAVTVQSSNAAEPKIIAHTSPPMESLPPLQDGAVVNAMDLMNHYKTDPVAADKRYRGRRIKVEGEVVALEKPMFISTYNVILKTVNPEWRVVCNVSLPPHLTEAHTADHGKKIMGGSSRLAPVTLVEVGQKVTISGRCKGLNDSTVGVVAAQLQ